LHSCYTTTAQQAVALKVQTFKSILQQANIGCIRIIANTTAYRFYFPNKNLVLPVRILFVKEMKI
jgi:hypothetical protein